MGAKSLSAIILGLYLSIASPSAFSGSTDSSSINKEEKQELYLNNNQQYKIKNPKINPNTHYFFNEDEIRRQLFFKYKNHEINKPAENPPENTIPLLDLIISDSNIKRIMDMYENQKFYLDFFKPYNDLVTNNGIIINFSIRNGGIKLGFVKQLGTYNNIKNK